MSNQWFNSIQKQRFILVNSGQMQVGDASFLRLFYAPTFTDDFYLQLAWYGHELEVVKTTLKEKGECIYLERKEGFINGAVPGRLIKAIKTLKVPPFVIHDDHLDGRDGAVIELTIGVRHHESTFCWWSASTPKDWNALDDLAEMILKLEKLVDYDDCKRIKVDFEEEFDEQHKTLIIEYNFN